MSEELERLSPREWDVLAAIVRGKCNKEIAGELSLSTATVKGYVANILAKLGVPSRTAAAGVWFRARIASAPAKRPGPKGGIGTALQAEDPSRGATGPKKETRL